MYAVIMAGGKGERLWPKSARGKAKHCLSFGTRNVMIKETIKRLKDSINPQNLFLITTKSQYKSLKPYVSDIDKKNIILEPEGRDTACAICLAALTIQKRFGDQTMIVLPADHIIKASKAFSQDLLFADKIASASPSLVTLGIRPKYASVGYGYIKTGKKMPGYYAVKRFIEKPKKKNAEKFSKKKDYLWNSGIFIWKTSSILNALKKHTPKLYYSLKDTIKFDGKRGFALKLQNCYRDIKPVSIDYAVMEPTTKSKAQKILCIKSSFDWIDIGSWSSVEEIYDKDPSGNIVLANTSLLDVKNSIVIGEMDHKVGVIGLKDIIIVQTKSGTLICNKNRAQDVKTLVKSFNHA
ncbi:MAG: sugar phosphate nucleotidyltransferase [Candidatus Omnitrophota bacterium]